ncbi:MAG: oxidoreductase [Zetaproteobacteria bacterium]|nr:oxidoreductase [Pseudobdellovibrionaceae bacterium]
MPKKTINKKILPKFLLLGFFLFLWFSPPPNGLTLEAWHLFAIFITTISTTVFKFLNVFTVSILSLSFTILTKTLAPNVAYSGFSKDTILLIVVAFIIAKAVVKSGLGNRIACHIVSKIGQSTLGLAYSAIITDCLIGPAFPSNTARSGVLYPIIEGLALTNKSSPKDGTENRIGKYLMMNSLAGLSISSALWLTGMVTNIVGAGLAKNFGIQITFSTWFLNALVPSSVALAILPWLLKKMLKPQIEKSPQAPLIAKKKLQEMGPTSTQEKVVALTFFLMVLSWSLSEVFFVDKTAVSFLGLGALMLFKVIEVKDIKNEGNALVILIWFAVLYTLSAQLSELGFMKYIGNIIASSLKDFNWLFAYIILIISYILAHYLFVSQSAHLLALFGIFLQVGIDLGIPSIMFCYMLLFATNFFSALTPQASSANIIFIASDYIKTSEVYKFGAIITLVNTFIYLTLGSFWIYFLNY